MVGSWLDSDLEGLFQPKLFRDSMEMWQQGISFTCLTLSEETMVSNVVSSSRAGLVQCFHFVAL